MTAVEVKGLTFAYSDKPVIKDISFKAERGVFTAVIGPNGSGKTTLMRLISAALKPRAGDVLINGKSAGTLNANGLAKALSYVPQKPEPIPFTVMDVVLMGRYAYRRRFSGLGAGDIAAAEEAIYLAGLDGYEKRRLDLLSGGEQQRVFIAKAFAQQAGIILLDEPTAGLDISYQMGILATVKKLCLERDTAVICVLHDINLACALADRVAIISAGELEAFDHPERAIDEQRLEMVYGVKMTSFQADGGCRYYFPEL